MARYQLALVAIILLLALQDISCYKQKNEYKKNKEYKYKNKVSGEVKNHHKNHQHHHNHHHRQVRAAEEEKYKAEMDGHMEEKMSYVVERQRKSSRVPEEAVSEYETCPRKSSKSCGKRQENGLVEKKKKKTCYVMVDEEEPAVVAEVPERTRTKKQMRREIDATSAVTAKKGKNLKKRQSYVIIEEEPESAPEDVQYKVIVNKKQRKERKVIPSYIYVDETADEEGLAEESAFSGKTLKKKVASYIIEGLDENENENRTGRRYVIDEMLDQSAEEDNTLGRDQDEEEENEAI